MNKLQFTNDDIDYLLCNEIFEYDMKAAGLSVIKKYNLIPKEELEGIESLSKKERNIFIGNLKFTHKDIHEHINKCLLMELNNFATVNEVSSDKIISAKRDALFITKYCTIRTFGEVKFAIKNQYSSYIRLPNNKIEFYCNKDKIDVKGISDEKLINHEDFMTSFVFTIIRMIETNAGNLKSFMKDFIRLYKNLELPSGFYREFNSESKFIYKRTMNVVYGSDIMWDEDNKGDLDISYNFVNVIIPLFNIVLTIK
ncbi:MAG: hypothetical protein PHF63_00955 [Herbinix sp.]|nr:hypothetical protein [Herbinix sp.]